MMPGFASLPDWLSAAVLLGHLPLGVALGIVHFSAVRRTAQALVEARGGEAVALVAGRIALTGGTLLLVGLEGALPLLATAAGLTIGRLAVIRAGEGAAS